MEFCLSFLPTGISNLHDHRDRMSTPDDHELPSYESPIRGLEYQRSLERGKNQKWLSVFIKSGAKNASSMPMFFENDDILGRVEIDLEKAESVKCVTITIQAGTTFVGQDENIFLTETQTLWTPTAESGSKLKGKHSWPFKFVLKREVPMKEEKKSEMMYRLPPNFTETASPAYIDYKLIVTVHRGLLRVNQVLSTSLGYLPTTFPDPPSTLRRLAYQENTQLIGPDGDPQGWKVLTPVIVKGTLFSAKPVKVECTLAIASPLSYAVGSAIPFIITFKGDDAQVLDVLGKPSTVRLRLVRSMATGSEATDDMGSRRTDNHFLEQVGQAYFWDSKGAQDVNKRVFQGEMELVKTLKPSFKFPNFTIRYKLELSPFEAAGFVGPVYEGKYPALLSEQVTITTKQIPGLTIRSYAPPGYEKPKAVDYSKSVGLLENGNQRFLHHGNIG